MMKLASSIDYALRAVVERLEPMSHAHRPCFLLAIDEHATIFAFQHRCHLVELDAPRMQRCMRVGVKLKSDRSGAEILRTYARCCSQPASKT